MSFLKILMVAVQVLSALGVIGLVLLQHGKGADMGAAFGSGASGSLFGATGSANFLSRTTAILATVFFISTLALTYLGSYKSAPSIGLLGTPAVSTPASAAAATSQPAAASGASDVPSAAASASGASTSDVPK